MPQFSLELSDNFHANYRSKRPEVKSELDDALRFLNEPGPLHNSLNSHKIEGKGGRTSSGVQIWESYVTWAHRITWHYKADFVIYLRATNGHEIIGK